MDPTPSVPVLELFSLSGQNALITGASRGIYLLRAFIQTTADTLTGIGAACALALAQAGANLCLVLRPPADKPSSSSTPDIVSSISAACPNVRIEVVHADLSDITSVKAVFPQALEKMHREIDIFVNCAGIQRRAPAEIFSEDDWDEVRQSPFFQRSLFPFLGSLRAFHLSPSTTFLPL